jgi:hypothetical protein
LGSDRLRVRGPLNQQACVFQRRPKLAEAFIARVGCMYDTARVDYVYVGISRGSVLPWNFILRREHNRIAMRMFAEKPFDDATLLVDGSANDREFPRAVILV